MHSPFSESIVCRTNFSVGMNQLKFTLCTCWSSKTQLKPSLFWLRILCTTVVFLLQCGWRLLPQCKKYLRWEELKYKFQTVDHSIRSASWLKLSSANSEMPFDCRYRSYNFKSSLWRDCPDFFGAFIFTLGMWYYVVNLSWSWPVARCSIARPSSKWERGLISHTSTVIQI